MSIKGTFVIWLALLMFGAAGHAAEPAPSNALLPASVANVEPKASPEADHWIHTEWPLDRLINRRSSLLNGLADSQVLEFTLRKDRIVRQATLNLVFTPSPTLVERLSHIRVYLNDELMAVVPINVSGKSGRQSTRLPLEPNLMRDFNQIRLEFVGHYESVCADPANSSLWLDLSGETRLMLEEEPLSTRNDLAFFPEPFLDLNDMQTQAIPFVFPAAPDETLVQAAGVLASYFGSTAGWRQVRFPVVYDRLPAANAIVMADNLHRPAFLAGYPAVDGPTLDLISAPDDPAHKWLLILGRDGTDILKASQALASGSPLLRGRSVQIKDFEALADRLPYDAPRWVPTDRPVSFKELADFPGQLEVRGLQPAPIVLNLNLPPDLFVWRNAGIPMKLRYRYTPPSRMDESKLNISLNRQFVRSFPLLPAGQEDQLLTRLPLMGDDSANDSSQLLVPALKVGANNQLRFDFSFSSTLGSAQQGQCQTKLPVDQRAAIDQASYIDFSGFQHYLEMPNLRAFSSSGYPFSRMADLSETILVVPSNPGPRLVSSVLEVLAFVSAQTGVPAYRVRVMHDWQQAADQDADLIWFGQIPDALRKQPNMTLLIEGMRTSLKLPRDPQGRQVFDGGIGEVAAPAQEAVNHLGVVASAPLAAILEMQSGSYPQRSWLGLLASTPADFDLLQDALSDTGKRDAIKGGVSIIRESGVYSSAVGQHYFVGYLPWWQRLWYQLSNYPVLLATVAVAAVILVAVLLWWLLRRVARRRLERDA
ncbi:MAG: cellulose biosynthesis cyclic di-GMP-binding regulatory protein BcsB [Castellaniella sp.]